MIVIISNVYVTFMTTEPFVKFNLVMDLSCAVFWQLSVVIDSSPVPCVPRLPYTGQWSREWIILILCILKSENQCDVITRFGTSINLIPIFFFSQYFSRRNKVKTELKWNENYFFIRSCINGSNYFLSMILKLWHILIFVIGIFRCWLRYS